MIKIKLERQIAERQRRANARRKPLSKGTGKDVIAMKTVQVEHMGSVDCGQVLPFMPVSELQTVAVPDGAPATDIFTVRARGISLSNFGVQDGDLLICTKRFSTNKITQGTVCVVYIHSTGELVAKRIIRAANTLILRASGGNIPDREVSPDEIEIRGIVTDVQRPISEFMRLACEGSL